MRHGGDVATCAGNAAMGRTRQTGKRRNTAPGMTEPHTELGAARRVPAAKQETDGLALFVDALAVCCEITEVTASAFGRLCMTSRAANSIVRSCPVWRKFAHRDFGEVPPAGLSGYSCYLHQARVQRGTNISSGSLVFF